MTTEEILASVGLTRSAVERLCKKMEYERELDERYSRITQAEKARMNEIIYHKKKERDEIQEQQLQSMGSANFGIVYDDNFDVSDLKY